MDKTNRPPRIVVPGRVEVAEAETVRLPNGLGVHLICTPGQRVARVSFVFAAGSSRQTKPFAASSTLNLLAEGSETMTAMQIAEKMDYHGSYYEVNIDRDYSVATFCSLGKFFEPTLRLADEIMFRPAFPQHEIDNYTRKRKQGLALERSKPSTKARELFSQALFGDSHPYGISSPEAAYDDLRRGDIEDFYRRFYCAGNCFAVCSLGSGREKDALLELLSRMPAGDVPSAASFPEPVSDARRSLVLPEAVQSAVRIGRILFPRTHPDFIGMQVVATVLGGYFGSRLIRNLREEMGYTYGVMAAMVTLRESGYLAIATEVGADATADAVERIFGEMERLCREPVPEEELENARRSMIGEVMRVMDGPFGAVDVTIEKIQSGGIPDYINRFIGEVRSTDAGRIMELSRKYLSRDAFTTVIVGREG